METPQPNTKREAIKQALNLRYNIRFNAITAKLEYCEVGTDSYSEVTTEVMRSFKSELNENGIHVTSGEITQTFTGDVFKKNDTTNDDQVQAYIRTVMETRFNTIKTRVEYRLYDDRSGSWRTLDKYFLNSLALQIKSYGYKTSRQALQDLLESEFSPKINPLCQFFEELPDYTGDPIQELANTVKCVNSQHWDDYLKKWLVATLANVYDDERCTNHTMLILCGAQGAYKTTWIENLMPDEIKRYMYSGKLDMDKDKDNNAHLAENLIINLDDQMKDLLTRRGYEAIKNIITKNYITYRRPYDVQTSDYPRIASLIGSINGTDFLNDPTGSRRFLPFEVESIDIKTAQKINMCSVWRQAYDLYKSGYRYYFNADEIKELTKNNEAFAIMTLEEELILSQYIPAKEKEPGASFIKTIDLINNLTKLTYQPLKEQKIYDALQKNGFIRTRIRIDGFRQYGYMVKYTDYAEV